MDYTMIPKLDQLTKTFQHILGLERDDETAQKLIDTVKEWIKAYEEFLPNEPITFPFEIRLPTPSWEETFHEDRTSTVEFLGFRWW